MSTAVEKLPRESAVTVLSLLKSFYDQDVFLQLTKEFYNSDPAVSLTAIRSSAVIGNEFAVPHLYTLIEKGSQEQKVEAIRTLAVIRAPSSVGTLIKYIHLFPDNALKLEIVTALTAIGSHDEKYRELLTGFVNDGAVEETLRVAAARGVSEFASEAQLRELMKTAPLAVKKTLIECALVYPPEQAAGFFQIVPDVAKTLDNEALGRFYAGHLLFVRLSDQKAILKAFSGKGRGAIASFLQALLDCSGEIAQPLKVFKTLLILPYLNRETEQLTGQNLEKIVEIMRERSPFVLNELATITIAHLEALSGKIKKNFLSLGTIQQKEGLLSLLFARLIENYATPALLEDVQRYFKGNKYVDEQGLISDIRKALRNAAEEEKNQFKACMGLFNPQRKADQLKTQTMLSNVDLGRPFLLRRLNRFIRLAGLLGIKTMIKNIQRVLEFSRNERIAYLEETTVVSLCQLYDKPSLDKAAVVFSRPRESLPTLKGYVRGLRFCHPPLYLKELGELVLKPEIPVSIKLCALETLRSFDPKLTRPTIPYLIKALFLPKRDPQLAKKLEEMLMARAEANVFQVMLGFFNSKDKFIRLLAIRVLREVAVKDTTLPREVLVNRYYLLMEEEDADIRQEALVALLCLKDDYAIQVFGDYFKSDKLEEAPRLLGRLPSVPLRDVVQFLLKQITLGNAAVHAALRPLFEEVAKSDFAEERETCCLISSTISSAR